MKSKLMFYLQYALLIFAMLSSCYVYFLSLAYFWSGFKDSPFGCETCGMEAIVWPLLIFPGLVIAFLVKVYLSWRFKYPRIFLLSPIFMAVLISMFTFDKGYGQGIMAASFIFWEVFVDIYSAIRAGKSAG